LLISFIGLYFFWRPARVLYCMSIAIGILIGLDPHYGPEVLPQLEGLLDNINSILSGVILCLIFTPPIKQLFANKTVAQ